MSFYFPNQITSLCITTNQPFSATSVQTLLRSFLYYVLLPPNDLFIMLNNLYFKKSLIDRVSFFGEVTGMTAYGIEIYLLKKRKNTQIIYSEKLLTFVLVILFYGWGPLAYLPTTCNTVKTQE